MAKPTFLVGGGEMGDLIRTHDWSKTAIGPMESWSPALRMQVDFLLANRFPILLWWGPTFCSIYNDAYAPILGTKHPWALGRPVSECWSEIWDVLRPLIETPFHGGAPTWIEDFELEIRRHGYLEEGHFTVAYSPVPDERAPRGIGGVVATVHEISATVIGERRVATLRDLGSRAGEAKTAEQACEIAAATLGAHSKDLPFVLLYLIDAEGRTANLAGASGVARGSDIGPVQVRLDAESVQGWPLARARQDDAMIVVDGLAERFTTVPSGPWSDPPHTAVVLAIPSNKPRDPVGLLVAGLSPRLQLDDRYRDFLVLLQTQLATGIANARTYEEEKKRAESLAAIDRAKTIFFSNVSHEFRTPLTLMLGPLDDLLAKSRTDLSPAAAEQLAVVNRNGVRLLRLVNTLLDFSRIEAGRMRATYQPTDLATFTAELASVFRAAVEKAGLRLQVDCPPLSEPVFVDRDMWEKIVLNLLSNAFKFTLEGEIAVTLRPMDTHVELQVRDTGTGIPVQEMPRLFERFHRIQNVRGRTHEGSGIGLALVQELVRLHGGSIRAESTLGQGTTFSILMPLGSAHLPSEQIGTGRSTASTVSGASPYVDEALRWLPDQTSTKENAVSQLPTHAEVLPVPALQVDQGVGDVRPSVLVADDNADMRQYINRLLAERYRIEVVADGAAALAAARARRPDLILTDVMMPRLDGFGLLRALRADPGLREIPVIMLSARAGEESRVEGMEAGADDYLVKPFSARELLARVGAHLQMTRMRREASDALRESEARFRNMADHAPVMIWVTEADGTCSYLSKSWYEFTGQGPEAGLGFGWVDVVHPSDRSTVHDMFLEGNAKREPFRLEYRLRRQDGQYRWAMNAAAPRFAGDGTMLGYVGSMIDITERKQDEEVLREADRRKDEFLATLAHELRNPLAPIRNSLEILKRAGGNPEAIEASRATMERQVLQLARLVEDLFDVSRITRNQLSLRREIVDLASIVQRAVEACRPLADAAGHEMVIRLPAEPIDLDADAARLAQVFGNLLANACKFIDAHGRIELIAERIAADPLQSLTGEAGQVRILVKDDGVGIPPDMLSRVFDMFTQVDGSLERSRGGLGIGLTLVKRLVELHGGTVTARSAGPGRGSEFEVLLPALAPAERPLPAEPKPEPIPSVSRRILIVDDNRDAAKSLDRLLELMGNETETVHDGVEAVQRAAEFRPDVIFLDIGMRGMNGYDVCRAVRGESWGKDILILALTGWGQEEDRRKSKAAGFDAHLVKPVDYSDILKLLASQPFAQDAT